jgi:hypothetical protein
MTREISSSEIDMGEGTSGRYEVLGMSERSASGMGKNNRAIKASTFSLGVIALPEEALSLGINGGVGRR